MAVNMKFICDEAALLSKLDLSWKGALVPLSELVLADCNEYVKVDLGLLRASSYLASDLAKGTLIWNTPYAKRQYYTGTPNTSKNPNASLQWCEKASQAHKGDWEKAAQKLFKEKL